MGPHLINADAADRLVGALCSTLMHSLWQGILLAAVAGVIIICTRKASSALRYNLLIGSLLMFAVGVGATFAWQYGSPRPVSAAITGPMPHFSGNATQVHPPQGHVFVGGQELSQPRFTERMNNFLSEHHNSIVFVWFLIVCARSLQLGFGLYGTYRLRRVRVMAVKGDWQQRLRLLADGLGIKQAVSLLESGLAKVPMVIGHLKPVILVPVGLLTALSAEEVEAILIHELAHIKRRDYLVNMLQSLMEIVFFFNPAVLWVSKLIKIERENCCDDLAVAQNNNKINYIRALVSCEEYQASVPAYAMGLTGRKNTLLNRVKRMVSNKNYSLNLFEKTVLAICLVVLGLGVSAFTAREDIKKAVKSIVAAIHQDVKVERKAKVKVIENDTTKKKQVEANNEVNQLLNKLTQLHSDTLKTTNSPEVNALIFKIDSLRLNEQQSGLNANILSLKGGNLQPLNMQQRPDTMVTKLLNNNNKINRQLLFNLKPDTSILNKLRQTSAIGRELYREGLITDTNHLSITTHLDKHELIVNGVRMPEDVYQRIYTKFYKKGENGGYGINYENGNSYGISYSDRYGPSGAPVPPTVIIPDFGDTLVKYGVIKDKRNIHVIFNNHELVINGVKQPDDVFRMLLKKYVSKPGDNVNITYTNNGLPDKRMEENTYWAGQQRKIIDQMQREGLIDNRKGLSFLLTNKQFRINGIVQSDEVFQRYHQEYVPANAGDDWNWNYHNPPGNYSAYANGYRNSAAYYQLNSRERQRIEAERDKKLVADLLQDGLITDPNNVTFSLSDKELKINGKKQSDEIYQKYRDKYIPDNTSGNWSWNYSHHE